jgi:hypothetical protein
MAKYLLLIHGVDEEWEAMTPEQLEEHDAAHVRFRAAAGERVVGGEELERASTATTLRGEMITDGPFLETKEVLDVVHLIFTTGHAPPAGEEVVRRDLVGGAIALARLLTRCSPSRRWPPTAT